MRNIERHFFSNAMAAAEYAFHHNLGNPASWGTQAWIDYTRWLVKESEPGAPIMTATNLSKIDNPAGKIDSPSHYRHRSGFDAIVWIDRYKMDFSTGNCFKYLFRRGMKAGETSEDDEGKAKWYFRHAAEIVHVNVLVQWEDAKKIVFDKLAMAFGPPRMTTLDNGDKVEDWSGGGCDMPEAVEFLVKECLPMLQA